MPSFWLLVMDSDVLDLVSVSFLPAVWAEAWGFDLNSFTSSESRLISHLGYLRIAAVWYIAWPKAPDFCVLALKRLFDLIYFCDVFPSPCSPYFVVPEVRTCDSRLARLSLWMSSIYLEAAWLVCVTKSVRALISPFLVSSIDTATGSPFLPISYCCFCRLLLSCLGILDFVGDNFPSGFEEEQKDDSSSGPVPGVRPPQLVRSSSPRLPLSTCWSGNSMKSSTKSCCKPFTGGRESGVSLRSRKTCWPTYYLL